MQQVFDMIQRLRATASKNDKVAILKEFQDDEEVKAFLYATLEPSINYFQKTVHESDEYNTLGPLEFNSQTLASLKNVLAERDVTGHAAKRYLTDTYMSMNDVGKELLRIVIEHDPRAGFSVSTVNKVWPGLITKVPYMRSCLPKDAKIDEFPWETGVISQLKADGMYVCFNNTDKPMLFSRSGSPFPLSMFTEIIDVIKEYGTEGFQYQGELLVMRWGEVLDRKTGNGILNSILQGDSFESGDSPVFIVWDVIPVDQAVAKAKIQIPYTDRFGQVISEFTDDDNPVSDYVQAINTEIVYSYDEAYQHFLDVIRLGGEGTIFKHPQAPWVDSTSKFQVKMKVEATVDLEIIGFKPGEGQHADTFGSIITASKDRLLVVSVSGMSKDKRKEISDNRDYFMGKIMAVTANEVIKDRNEDSLYSLFLPRFTEIRLDKFEADTLQEIIDQFEAVKKNEPVEEIE